MNGYGETETEEENLKFITVIRTRGFQTLKVFKDALCRIFTNCKRII